VFQIIHLIQTSLFVKCISLTLNMTSITLCLVIMFLISECFLVKHIWIMNLVISLHKAQCKEGKASSGPNGLSCYFKNIPNKCNISWKNIIAKWCYFSIMQFLKKKKKNDWGFLVFLQAATSRLQRSDFFSYSCCAALILKIASPTASISWSLFSFDDSTYR